MSADSRPDPDEVLRRVQAEAQRENRARLEIYLGFAPGVGKTYAMLEKARELSVAGEDVVVGWVETHGRYDTAALLLGLEVLPRRRLVYREQEQTEFDLDAALARKPKILLVDELAHTNVPGSRHEKRWQDVEELLAAGIEVHATLNIQHVESLNDVVAQITGVRVRETVPDAIVDRADELVLIDLEPEHLLVRLREGKVYLGENAERAARGFFRRGNLLALRELALRRTAERVDIDVQAYRRAHGIAASWPVSERVLVCVGPAPASERLVRAACRIAAGLRAPWSAVWVEHPATTPLPARDREQLEANLQLAESLGAGIVRLVGTKPSEAILEHARANSISRIVIGKPTHSRWRDLLRGSLLDDVVRGSGPIDVHVILGDDSPLPPQRAPRESEVLRWSSLAVAAALVGLVTGAAALAWRFLALPDVAMLYLLAILVCAVRWGRAASVLAATLSVAAYDFFFIEPYYTFAVSDLRHGLTFAAMFAIGLVISALALRIGRHERAAVQREQRTAALLALTRELDAALDADAVAGALAKAIHAVFGRGVAVLLSDPETGLAVAARAGEVVVGEAETAVARYAVEHDQPAGAGTDTLPGARVSCLPLRSGPESCGALIVAADAARGWHGGDRDLLESFARHGALVLARSRLVAQSQRAALRARTEELRSALLSSVSHDLRTPLAAITGSVSVLRSGSVDADPTQRDELLATIADEAGRLERLLTNLLDMTRLDAGVITPRRDWVPLEEIVGSALARLESQLEGRPVHSELPADLPLVFVDPLLFEQLVYNLLENAAKHTPAGTPIELRAARRDGAIEFEVLDRGPGIAPGDAERIFEKFQRGVAAASRGAGLGLAICRGIATLHGAALTAGNRSGGGACFRLRLPAPEAPPEAQPQELREDRAV